MGRGPWAVGSGDLWRRRGTVADTRVGRFDLSSVRPVILVIFSSFPLPAGSYEMTTNQTNTVVSKPFFTAEFNGSISGLLTVFILVNC